MERPELNIHGKNLDAEEREKAKKHYERSFEMGLKPIEGEDEKSGEELRFIEKIGKYLNEELASLGLEEVHLDPKRIHILSVEAFRKKFPRKKDTVNGVYLDSEDGVHVKNYGSRMQVYKSLLHEVVHQISFRSVYANPETRMAYVIRTGYANAQPTEDEHEHFRGLNEAVVDRITQDILVGHKDELIKDFNITAEEQSEEVSYYRSYMELLATVMKKIAQEKNESEETVWARFKRGEFTGEMMHLRDVEDVFGRGSLRVLSALDSSTKNMLNSKMVQKMKEYFEAEDEATREKIAKEVLIERERLRYGQRRN